MPLLDAAQSHLLLIDFQQKLMPAIADGAAAAANAVRLARAAVMLDVPILRTEQYPKGLGATVTDLAGFGQAVEKTTFSSCREPSFKSAPLSRDLVVAGCETHVCVLQTVLGLLEQGRNVFVVADAVGSRTEANRRAGLDRMRHAGAEIVTTEMVVFEWVGDSTHPHFRDISKLIR